MRLPDSEHLDLSREEMQRCHRCPQHARYQVAETEAAKLYSAIPFFIFFINICAFSIVTCQNVFHEKGLMRALCLSHIFLLSQNSPALTGLWSLAY